MTDQTIAAQTLDIIIYNKNALNNLRRAVVLGQGQFSLILARVNYRHLQELLLQELSDALRLKTLQLPPGTKSLREALAAAMQRPPDLTQALMVTGLASIQQLGPLLKAANLGRDELPKICQCPVVLWINDTDLQQLNRCAPDLKSFAATPIRFEYPIHSLVSVLSAQANDTYRRILETDQAIALSLDTLAAEPMADQELSFALAQLEQLPERQEQAVSHKLIADLLFLQGRHLQQQGDLIRARSYYENSLTYWQSDRASSVDQGPTSPLDKQAVLLFYLGLWWRSQAVLQKRGYIAACERAQQYFQACLNIFRQQNRPDRLGRFILAQAEVLQKLEDWPALSAIAQSGIRLHQSDPARLARDYGYLAEVAITRYKVDPHPHYLSEAQGFAQQALEISEQAIATAQTAFESSAESSSGIAIEENLLPLPLENAEDELRADNRLVVTAESVTVSYRQTARQTALRYHRGSYWYLLAIAQQLQGQPEAALSNLEKARELTNPHYDLSLYRRILNCLWQLYYDRRHYAEAFEVKLALRRVENLFGLRAFIGAGQIQLPTQRSDLPFSPAAVATSIVTAQVAEQMLAAEIKASGREQDIDALINRLAQPRYPIVVIHGQSGVGKSSILSAGLIPRLKDLIAEGRTTLPLMIASYSNWPLQIASAISATASADAAAPSEDETLFEGRPIDQLALLTREKYQQIVLIFDQFEDFFYEHPAVEQRRSLYAFLRDCLNLPYIKVVLALREDFLHYLLEWDRYADLSIVENDVLSKEIRYYLGNFMPKAAEKVIRQLTEAAGFHLEAGLVTALVDDLAGETGEIRPIELQVVGAQLQRQNITTLEAYQGLGRSPKNQLLKSFLENVMHDCGPENSSIAQSVLYLLSEGNRPLKSHSELIEALAAVNIHPELQQLQLVLDILIGSGLVFEVPEVSGVRYQLVHEYLASLVQQQPIDLVEALQTERHRRQLTEEQLQQALAAQSDSLVQTTLARQKTEIAEIKALISVAGSLRLSGSGLDALAKALRAARQLSRTHADPYLKMQTALCLDASVRDIREKNELTGHRNWVLAVHCQALPVAASVDERIASASEDGTLKLWNGRGELLRTLTGHQAGVLDVCFSPDGQHLASASLDHTVRLYQSDGEFIRAIEHASASITAISFSPSAPVLAATYSDAFIRIWSLAGDLIQAWEGHEDWARTVAFSPDGQTLVTGGEDQNVRLWTVDGEPLRTWQGHQGWVRSVAFSPNGQTIISAGDANTLRLWSLDGRKLRTFYGHEDWVRSVAFSPDGQRIASGSDDQTIKIWTLNATVEQTFQQRSSVHSVAWSADGQSVVSGGDDDQVHIWRLAGPLEAVCQRHAGIVWSVCWQPQAQGQAESSRLLSAGGDDLIKLWSDRGELLNTIVGHQRGVHSVDWQPDGQFFASASADQSVRIWSADGELIKELLGHEGAVWQVRYSPGGSRLASVSSDRTLRLWHTSGKLLKVWSDHTDPVWHVSFSPNGHHLVTASEDNTLRLWHHQTGLIQTINGHEGGVWCAAFSPDGRFVASGGADGVIHLWPVRWQSQQQLTLGLEPLILRGHRDWVRSLSFSSKGEFLASASDDGTVRLWSLLSEALNALQSVDLANSQVLSPLTGHGGVIWAVDFDRGRDRLVTASADGTVRIWDLRLDTLIEKGCDWLSDWLIARPDLAQQLCTPSRIGNTDRQDA
ncbi:MAG: hypothetical protein WBB01_20020 [Phormidesmis sp.]